MAPNTLHDQIRAALAVLRTARFDGDPDIITIAESHLNELIDQLDLVPV